MGKRFFFGFSMFFALVGLLAADHLLGFTWGLFLLCCGMCLGGIYELGRMFKFRGLPLDVGLLALSALALLGYVQLLANPPSFGAFARLAWGGVYQHHVWMPPGMQGLRDLTLLAPLLVAVIFPLVGLTRKDVSNLSPRITNNLGVFLYVIFPIAVILWLRKVPGSGPWLLYLLLAASRLGDVGAYLLGKAVGRHKLIPHLSAGKTIEGAIAGLAFSAIGGVIAVLWANNAGGLGLKPVLVEWWHGALLGGFVGIAAQSGDLVESGFKRAAGIKDSGQLVPSFGGVMDIMDNFMLTGPLILIVLALL
ncbi:MAG: phosphatidate cytidylyltransferase [Planctomycetes bacterium]|nr:phosphatidate cytidylyltransferase [Planctomycetota bacterium]